MRTYLRYLFKRINMLSAAVREKKIGLNVP